MYKAILVASIAAAIALEGCKKEETIAPGPSTRTLTLNMTGIEDLGGTAKYEGWILVSGNPKTTGTFTVNASGTLSQTQFQVNSIDLAAATAFVLTIEPNPDPNPSPTDIHLMAGDFSGNSATLSLSHSAALGNNFLSATGKYVLATPTDGMNTNEKSGVWFLDLSSGSPTQGLQLPTLPSGWVYEGWAVIGGTPVTTGTFVSPGAADNAAPYSGAQPAPPFPGEDFLVNAPGGLTFPTDLSGGMVVISIEPSPDNSAAPFTLKPLAATVPGAAQDHVTYSMTNQASTFPSGTATR